MLFPIERSAARTQFGIDMTGVQGLDVWNAYELGWLDPRGKPEVRRLRLSYPAGSPCIVESKSLKLYLGSFTMSRFESEAAVLKTIASDLKAILGTQELGLELFDWRSPVRLADHPAAELLDGLAVDCERYEPDPSLLEPREHPAAVERRHLSHLLKTNCPITGQPDWATLSLAWRGRRSLKPESLLRYIVSYREHGGYHEICAEEIFSTLWRVLEPESLALACWFTRRGGIDINPLRWKGLPEAACPFDFDPRHWRQ